MDRKSQEERLLQRMGMPSLHNYRNTRPSLGPSLPLSMVPDWPEYFLKMRTEGSLTPSSAINPEPTEANAGKPQAPWRKQMLRFFPVNEVINSKISLWQGDITHLAIDAIVNAANRDLHPGAGVCGCIHDAAGPELRQECSRIGDCPPGEARITGGYRLPAKYVIQAVGPLSELPSVLKSAYSSCFDIMIKRRLRSIAFPCISTGIYGYPSEAAAHVVLREARRFLEANHDKVDRVIFAVFTSKDHIIYEKIMPRYFPVAVE